MLSDSGVVMRMCGDFADHPLALARRRVAGAHRDANLGERQTGLLESPAQLGQRTLEVALDVVVERLER